MELGTLSLAYGCVVAFCKSRRKQILNLNHHLILCNILAWNFPENVALLTIVLSVISSLWTWEFRCTSHTEEQVYHERLMKLIHVKKKKKGMYHQCNKWSIANRHSDFCFISTVTLPLCPYCQATSRECRQEWRTFIPLSPQRVHNRTHLLIVENLDLGIFIFNVALQYLICFRWSTSEHFVISPILC